MEGDHYPMKNNPEKLVETLKTVLGKLICNITSF